MPDDILVDPTQHTPIHHGTTNSGIPPAGLPGTDRPPWFFERTVLIRSGTNTFAGLIYDMNTIITVRHGIQNNTIQVYDVYGNILNATIRWADPYSDVAIISAHTGMTALEMSPAGPGEPIYSVGHPKGRPYVVTSGVISSMHRDAPMSIQHDAGVTTGNSGGPVFDHAGRLVGMNTGMDDLAFAVPNGILSHVVDMVEETGSYTPGCVGILMDGHVVRTVQQRVAGIISPGDVILSMDGRAPHNLLFERSPGDVVTVQFQDHTIQVQLGYMGEWFGIRKCLDGEV